MALVAGTVTVADDEAVTGSGLALALYQAEAALLDLPTLVRAGNTTHPYSAARPATSADEAAFAAGRLRALRDVAKRANAIAGAMVAYLVANMEVVIPATEAADELQRGGLHPLTEKTLGIR